jgi:class 3 adenylate cyclase
MPDEPEKPSGQSLIRKLATILSADVAEFSRLMGEDEEQTLRTFRGHKQIFESLVAGHRGRVFNTAGDAILAEFGSAVEAVRCATDIQAALRTRNDQLPPNRQVRFRIGINLGDVMLHGQDLLGDGVNVAARLQTAAEPGGICISGSVHDQITNKLSLSFQALGEMKFKNIQVPVRTFSITHAQGFGDLPSPKLPGRGSSSAQWIAAALLLLTLLAAGAYWTFVARARGKTEEARVTSNPIQPEVTRPEATPASEPATMRPQIPPTAEPATRTPQGPRGGSPAAKAAKASSASALVEKKAEPTPQPNPHGGSKTVPAVATTAETSGRYDGVYSGPICYGEFKDMPERCFQAKGTISGSKIAGEWPMGTEKKVIAHLTGDVSTSGDIKIEIVQSGPVGSRPATINLTGTLRGGLINASGSFLRGRAATLNWHKNSDATH